MLPVEDLRLNTFEGSLLLAPRWHKQTHEDWPKSSVKYRIEPHTEQK